MWITPAKSGREISIEMLVPTLLLLCVTAAPSPAMNAWKLKDAWFVDVTWAEPSPAAVADPEPNVKHSVWHYQVVATDPPTLRVSTLDDTVEAELVFEASPARALTSITLFQRQPDGKRKLVDQHHNPWGPGASHLDDTYRGPRSLILSHPVLSAGDKTWVNRGGGYDRTVTQSAKPERDGGTLLALSNGRVLVTFLWQPGARWWARASQGGLTAVTRVQAP
jgi:hypothetical protein